MTATTLELAGTPLRTVFPVHSRHEDRWHDSVGWFITNSVLESEDVDPARLLRRGQGGDPARARGPWPT